jgi:hypothetical protein
VLWVTFMLVQPAAKVTNKTATLKRIVRFIVSSSPDGAGYSNARATRDGPSRRCVRVNADESLGNVYLAWDTGVL